MFTFRNISFKPDCTCVSDGITCSADSTCVAYVDPVARVAQDYVENVATLKSETSSQPVLATQVHPLFIGH